MRINLGLPTKTNLKRLRSGLLASAFFAIQIASPLALFTGTASATGNFVNNPVLTESCGLDIALVIDNSSSISSGEMGQIKTAMTGFTNALSGTPTQFSVTRFGDTASVVRNFTANVALVNQSINGIPTDGGGTNWEDGLLKAKSTFDPRADKPNLVIFASDGNPTFHIGGGLGYATTQADIDAAVAQANSIKALGTRILTIGIGDDLTVANLKAISGPNVNTGNVLTSDVLTSNFATLAADLANFAKQTCGGTITTKKIIDQDGNLNTTNDQSPASGWTFDINGSPSNPAPTNTAANGQTPAVKVSSGTYSVNETQQAGYEVLSASCNGAANNGSRQGNAVVGITVANDNIVNCTFVNTPSRGGVQVHKKLDTNGDGTYESGNSEAQSLGMFWKLNGGSNTTFGATLNGQTVGSHQVTETSPAGYHFTGWYYTHNTAQSCANPAGTTLPANITVSANVITTITLCNARDSGTLKVIKKVINDNGGTANASNFNLYVKNNGTNVAGSPAAGSANGTIYTLPTGTYTISEDAKAGYTQLSLTCLDQHQQTVAHPVVLGQGQYVTCTVINDDIAPSVTVTKQVVNPYGTPLDVASFPLFLGGTGVTSGTTYTNFNAGNYLVTETQQPGYELTAVSGDCVDAQGNITLTLANGVSSNCVLTNTAIQPKLIVKKKVINDNSGQKSASDFTMTVTGNSQTVPNFPGSPNGVTIGLNEGNYTVGEVNHDGYTQTLVGDCSGSISIGQVKTCTVINDDIPNPAIKVEKFGPATAFEGDTVTYTFKVTNTGDTVLHNITLSDDIAINESCPNTTLAAGASMTCTASYTIPSPQIDDVTNHVSVTGTDPHDTTVTGTDSHTLDVLHYGIKVVKSGPQTAVAGSQVTYTFTVTNTGDQPLAGLKVQDDIAGEGVYQSGDTNLDDKLDTDETWIFTAHYTIPAKQSAPVVNTVEVCASNKSSNNYAWDTQLLRNQSAVAQRTVTVCDTDGHTTNISVVLAGSQTSLPAAVLSATGQSINTVLLVLATLASTGLAGAMLVANRKG